MDESKTVYIELESEEAKQLFAKLKFASKKQGLLLNATKEKAFVAGMKEILKGLENESTKN